METGARVRIGYSFWGFLADYKIKYGKHVSSPDGNATYSWGIIHEIQRRGHQVLAMQHDRDAESWSIYGPGMFESFSKKERTRAYELLKLNSNELSSYNDFPDLDILLIEWRWPISGRNCDVSKDDPAYQPDLDRQRKLLEHYRETKTKIIIWDLDHKLTVKDEFAWNPDMILETSEQPLMRHKKRVSVCFPVVSDSLFQFPTVCPDPKRKLVYVGNRYERDDVIEQYIAPFSRKFPGQVEFWGGWTNEPNLSECRAMWPDISYNGRITTKDFRSVYSKAVAVPLLAKRSYLKTGFMSPRIWEAVLFGSIPVGFDEMTGIKEFLPPLLRVSSHNRLDHLIEDLSDAFLHQRESIRNDMIERISSKMDVSLFVNVIESVVQENKMSIFGKNEHVQTPVTEISKSFDPVKFTYRDGIRPMRRGNSGAFALRMPIEARFPRRSTGTIGLGMSCEFYSIILSDKNLTESGLYLSNRGQIFDEDELISVSFENKSDQDIILKQGDIVARLLIIDNKNRIEQIEKP